MKGSPSVVAESLYPSVEGVVGSGIGVQGVVGEYFLNLLDSEFGAEVDGVEAGVTAGPVGVIAQERRAEEFVCNPVGGGEAYDLHGWAFEALGQFGQGYWHGFGDDFHFGTSFSSRSRRAAALFMAASTSRGVPPCSQLLTTSRRAWVSRISFSVIFFFLEFIDSPKLWAA